MIYANKQQRRKHKFIYNVDFNKLLCSFATPLTACEPTMDK